MGTRRITNHIILLVLIFANSCFTFGKSTPDKLSNKQMLKELVNEGYSLDELALRTGYEKKVLSNALKNNAKLTDKDSNKELNLLYTAFKDEKNHPIKAYKKTTVKTALSEIQRRAKSLPILAYYTGVEPLKIYNALNNVKKLEKEDSLRVMTAYSDMKSKYKTVPTKIPVDSYFKMPGEIQKVILPAGSPEDFGAQTKLRVEIYIYQNEQFELLANKRLKEAIEKKVDKHFTLAVDSFINEDLNSMINTGLLLFRDSLYIQKFYEKKMNQRLNIKHLDKELRDEISAYCIAVNCSRYILVNNVLGYKWYFDNMDIAKKMAMQKYNIEMSNYIHERTNVNRRKLGIEAGLFIMPGVGEKVVGIKALSTALSFARYTKVTNFLVAGGIDMATYPFIEKAVYSIPYVGIDEKKVKNAEKTFKKKYKSCIDNNICSELKQKGNYYDALNANTKTYYDGVRDYFDIQRRH